MPLVNNNNSVLIGQGQRRVTVHTGQQDCGCHSCDLRRKMAAARPVTVRSEGSKRESYLRQLDEKYSAEVVDSLLGQIVEMALQPVSGSAKSLLDQLSNNAAYDEDEDFAMPGEETERRSGYRFQFERNPFANQNPQDDDRYEDFEMPKPGQQSNQRVNQRPKAQPARPLYTNLHDDPDFEDFEMPKTSPQGNPYVTYRR